MKLLLIEDSKSLTDGLKNSLAKILSLMPFGLAKKGYSAPWTAARTSSSLTSRYPIKAASRSARQSAKQM